MPINYQEVYRKAQELGRSAAERKGVLDERRKMARALLVRYASELDFLRLRVEAAKGVEPNLRCAVPLNEALDAHYPMPESAKTATLIAADGSQIVPDRHAAIQYAVVNVGVIAMQVGSGSTPEVFTETQLHMLDEFDETLFSESQIALQRDLAERRRLLAISEKYPGTVIALTEGPLILWGAAEHESLKDFEESLRAYLDVLSEMERRQVIVAGYVDKPAANWVTRLLELASTPQQEIGNLRNHHPLPGVTDLWLFSQMLGRHERSPIFALQARSAERYAGSTAIHFFYLNVGDERKPKIARVDIPLWVAANKEALDVLHYALVEQATLLGAEPFPYVLHRAHETAVITYREKEEIDQLLAREIRYHGGEVGEVSAKQSAKNLAGRTVHRK